MSGLNNIQIRHALLGRRIVLARMGKSPDVALETKDATSGFFQALASYAFEGEMPRVGDKAEITFGGGDEQFSVTITRVPPPATETTKTEEPRHD